MKILFITYKFNPDIGGIETVSEILAEEFFNLGYDVKVVTKTKSESLRKFNFDVVRDPGVKELMKLHFWADVIFENNPTVGLSWPALLLNKKTVTALHTWIARPDGKITIIDKLKRLKLKTAKAVIAVSNIIRENTFKNAIIIANPFQMELFTDADSSGNLPNFVFLGRLVSDKGVDMAIDAIDQLNKEGYKYSLTIIGDGPEKDLLIKQTIFLDLKEQVIFKGSLSGNVLVKELCSHKYMVVPSKWKEPFGLVALEGLASGCIPIVADGGGLPEAVGNAGLVFKRGSLNDLVTKMKLILTDSVLEEKLKTAAADQILAHQPTVIAKKYLEVITK